MRQGHLTDSHPWLSNRCLGCEIVNRRPRRVRIDAAKSKGGHWARLFLKKWFRPSRVPGRSEAPPGLDGYFLAFLVFLAFFAFFAFFAFLAIASSLS